MKQIIFLALCMIPLLIRSEEYTLEEKIGQMLIIHVQGAKANEDTKQLFAKIHPGGVVYYNWANQLSSLKQVQNLSQELQQLSPSTPLFIAVDQEGGRVARLREGFTTLPSAEKIADTLSPDETEALAKTVGKELRSAGVNMNFAPVVDVNSNPNNPIIGNRSFSSEPDTVILYADRTMQGYQQAGIIPVLKHFPGHGDTSSDSHTSLPIVYKSADELDHLELKPFRNLAASAPAIMTAHILVPAYDEQFPATVSKNIITRLLREKLGFSGVVISDSLVMEGVLGRFPSIEDAAIAAVNSGCDILILGGRQLVDGDKKLELSPKDLVQLHSALCNAVKEGRIDEKQIDRSVARIINLKKSLN